MQNSNSYYISSPIQGLAEHGTPRDVIILGHVLNYYFYCLTNEATRESQDYQDH